MLIGTIVNTITVICGSLIGMLLGNVLPERLRDTVMKGLGLFPEALGSSTKLLFANMGENEVKYILPLASALRSEGVSVEIYPDNSKLKKQFDYATRRNIPFLSITGEEEKNSGTVNIKNLSSGEQRSFSIKDIEAIGSFLEG